MEISGLTHVFNLGGSFCLYFGRLKLALFLKRERVLLEENKRGNSKKDIFKLPNIHSAMFVYLASFMTPSM